MVRAALCSPVGAASGARLEMRWQGRRGRAEGMIRGGVRGYGMLFGINLLRFG